MTKKKFFNLDSLKFNDKKLKRKIKSEFTFKNIWKHLALFIFVIGFILMMIPLINKIPLPFVGSVGRLGTIMFFLSGLYLAYEHRKEIERIMAILKLLIIAGISLIFFAGGGFIYYHFLRSEKINKDLASLIMKKSSSQQNINSLNLIQILRKDYLIRIIGFLFLYILTLNYFVINKNYRPPSRVGKLDKEENEIFWTSLRGFCFGLIVCLLISLRMFFINKNVLTVVKNIGEYSFMFSLITGLSAGITKYLVTVPLKLFFEII